MTFTLQPVWNWPVTLAIVIATVILVLRTYPKRIRHFAPGTRRTLMFLRLAAVLVLGLLLFRPVLEKKSSDEEAVEYLILADASRSMGVKDSPGGITRRQLLVQTAEQIQAHYKEEERVNISLYDFGETQQSVEKLELSQIEGEQSAIGHVLKWVNQNSLQSNTRFVFLLSDGAQRSVAPYDEDPLAEAVQLGANNIRVNTISIGGSGVADNVADLALQEIQVPDAVYEKKIVPIKAKLRAVGARGTTVRVRLLVEDRRGVKLGFSGKSRPAEVREGAQPYADLKITQDSQLLNAELFWFPSQPGEYKLAVEAVPLKDEVKINNNIKSSLVTVLKGGLRVAYLDRIRHETSSVGLVGQAEKVQVDTFFLNSGKLAKQNRLSPKIFERDEYDVYIIGDVPAEIIGESALQALQQRVEEGAGLMMIGGLQSFGGGGYGGSALDEVLPVQMSANQKQIGNRPSPDLHHLGDLQMTPTRAGLRHYVMNINSEDNAGTWKKLPPLIGANKLKKKSDFAEVLATDQDENPILISQDYGAGRVLAFGGDTTWQWFHHEFPEETLRFWQQAMLWLAHKEDDTDQPVWVKVSPRVVSFGQEVGIQLGARDDQGQPVNDAIFKVEVQLPDGEMETIPSRKGKNKNLSDYTVSKGAGDYWVRVQAKRNGRLIDFPAWGRFQVDERDLELDNPAADPGLLEKIAAATGGTNIEPEGIQPFLERLDVIETELEKVDVVRLWDNWWMMLAFVLLMSSEWGLRKMRGLV